MKYEAPALKLLAVEATDILLTSDTTPITVENNANADGIGDVKLHAAGGGFNAFE